MLIACVGCSVHHHPVNAPGHVEPTEPPEKPTPGVVEEPEDPGERMVLFTFGGLASVGVGYPRGQDEVLAYGLGPEYGLHFGQRDVSHAMDGALVLPKTAVGFNLGWTALASPGIGFGPLYLEGQYFREGLWAAGGWAYDVDDRVHGPQGELGLGPLFLRVTHLLDDSTALTLGVVVKGYQNWVFSR